MTQRTPSQWFSISELAALQIRGMPSNRRSMARIAVIQGWRSRKSENGIPLARKRAQIGGGMEFHSSLIPSELWFDFLLARARFCDRLDWELFRLAPERLRNAATERLLILLEVEGLVLNGWGITEAQQSVSKRRGVSARTIHEWRIRTRLRKMHEWLPRLLPRHKDLGSAFALVATSRGLSAKQLAKFRQRMDIEGGML